MHCHFGLFQYIDAHFHTQQNDHLISVLLSRQVYDTNLTEYKPGTILRYHLYLIFCNNVELVEWMHNVEINFFRVPLCKYISSVFFLGKWISCAFFCVIYCQWSEFPNGACRSEQLFQYPVKYLNICNSFDNLRVPIFKWFAMTSYNESAHDSSSGNGRYSRITYTSVFYSVLPACCMQCYA